MRGTDRQTGKLFSYASPESLVPPDHPLRAIRALVNAALDRLSPAFEAIYAEAGRPSIPPERLLRALLLQALFTIRSERQLMEQITYNMLFRWFVGLSMDVPVWDVTVFTKNRDRLLEGDIACGFLAAILADPAGQAAAVGRAFLGRWHADRSLGVDEELPPEGRQRRAAGAGRNGNATSMARSAATRRTPRPPTRMRGSTRSRPGQSAKLCHMGHVVMENRNGLVVATEPDAGHRHRRARGSRSDDRAIWLAVSASRSAPTRPTTRRTSSPRCGGWG